MRESIFRAMNSIQHHTNETTTIAGNSCILSKPSRAASLASIQDDLTDVILLNDLAIEHWLRNDLVATEQLFLKACGQLHSLCTTGAHLLQVRKATSSTHEFGLLSTTVAVGNESFDVFNRAFPLGATKSLKTWSLSSLDAIAAVVFYHTALFYQLHGQGHHGQGHHYLCGRSKWEFIITIYEQAEGLFGRYMDTTRRPLWLFQAALWYNLGKCYLGSSDFMAANVFVEQIKTIINWVDPSLHREFFRRGIYSLQPRPRIEAARVA